MSELLQCTGLQRKFGDFVAAKGIDLNVQRAEIVGIIGANGAGKTTLLNMISGYLAPTAGRIVFDGEDITGENSRSLARRGIARSFQVPQLFARETVRENMMVALSLLADPPGDLKRRFATRELAQRAEQILVQYEIDDHSDAIVANIPQGVRKLLDIAMATCAQPKLVLLDEPTSGVSNDEKDVLLSRLIASFRQSATTVVFIEHDMEVVRIYASRVVALYDGSVIADGSADTVFNDAEVRRLIVGGAALHRGGGVHATA